MEYVEVVVKIPEIVKAKIDDNINACDLDIYDCVVIAVKNGSPLPKGHGRLCDLDAALECIEEGEESKEKFYAKCLFDWACSKRVVIEADKTESED